MSSIVCIRLVFWTGSRLTTGWFDVADVLTVKLYLGSPGIEAQRIPTLSYGGRRLGGRQP